MERRRNLVRRVAPAGLALLVIGGLSGCSGEGPVGRAPAAVVGGHEISPGQVLDLARSYAKQAQVELDRAGETGGDGGGNIDTFRGMLDDSAGDGAGTYGTGAASDALRQLITYQLVINELDANDIEVTDEDVDAARTKIEEGFDEATKEAVDADLVTFTARSQAAEEKFATLVEEQDPTEPVVPPTAEELEAEVQGRYEQDVVEAPLCLSVAWALDESAAQVLRDRVDAGESFEAVAAQTIDPRSSGPGGFFDCGSATDVGGFLQADVADAAVGDVFGPIDLSQGEGTPVIVAQIVSTTGATLEQARERIQQEIDDELTQAQQNDTRAAAKVTARKVALAEEADVTVDPRYGTWDAATGQLVPPTDPGAPATTTPEVVAIDPAGS